MSYRFLILVLLISHWPIWLWYVRRMSDGSDEPWGVLALVSCLAFVPWKRLRDRVPLKLLGGVVLAQLFFVLVAINWVPILRALFVALMLGFALVHLRAPAGIMGLLGLSLPWIATLQFYVGFPLRVFTGEVSKWILLGFGVPVQREGIVLLWSSQQVVIDRPCAGIYMLWFGGYLAYFLASVYGLDLRQCLTLGITAFVLVLVLNILRNVALFFLEAGIIEAPEFAHEGVGVFLFLIAIGLLAKIAETKRVPGRALRSAD